MRPVLVTGVIAAVAAAAPGFSTAALGAPTRATAEGAALARALPAAARSAGWTGRVVRHAGVRIRVPADWPIYDLSREPYRCVRFDRHAVYLGEQGPEARCPAHLVGRTEAVQIVPEAASASDRNYSPVTMNGSAFLARDGAVAHDVTLAARAAGTVVRTTYGGNRELALQISGTAAADPASLAAPKSPAPAAAKPAVAAAATTATGYGFDACTAPSTTAMNAWLGSPYRTVGIYVGGANRACGDGNLSASWISYVAARGWRALPIYVGLQAPCVGQGGLAHLSRSVSTAVGQGKSAADDAVARAQRFGLGRGNPVYFDMEYYDTSDSSCVNAVNAFVGAYTTELHRLGYLAGVYSSSRGIRSMLYGSTPLTDDVWIANWNGKQSVFGDPYVPDSAWSHHQRVHQYAGGHNATYGGVTINIDSNYVDGAVAPATPATKPAAPQGVVATAGDASAAVRWSAGAAGTAPLVSYTLTASPGGRSVTVAASRTTATVPGLTNGTSYQFAVTATSAAGSGPAAVSNAVIPAAPASASLLHPLTARRVLDTRVGTGAPRARLAAGGTLNLRLPLPAGATAAVLNVTAVNPSADGYLTAARPGGPSGMNVTFPAGTTTAGLTTARVGTDGTVAIRSSAATDVVADLAGYYQPGARGLGFHPLDPRRFVDTRLGFAAPVTGFRVQVPGVPHGAVAAVEVTAVRESAAGYLTVSGSPATGTSNLNFAAGQLATNLVVTQLASDGTLTVSSSAPTHVVLAAVGYYDSAAGGRAYHPLDAVRVMDTRIGVGAAKGPVAGGTGASVDVSASTAVPRAATAVALDITTVRPPAAGYLSAYPRGGVAETVLTFNPGTNTTALALPKVGTGTVTLRPSQTLDIVADVEGYFD